MTEISNLTKAACAASRTQHVTKPSPRRRKMPRPRSSNSGLRSSELGEGCQQESPDPALRIPAARSSAYCAM